jgi:YD repeat-containing protein
MNGTTLSYDQKNQLKTLTGLDASGNLASVRYQYDAMGRRIAKTVNATTTLYAYDGWNVVEEYSTLNLTIQMGSLEVSIFSIAHS